MEEKVTSIDQLNVGDTVLVDVFMKNMFGVVFSKDKEDKYCITDSEGRRCRSLGRQEDGSVGFVTAEEEGCTGDELQERVDILLEHGNGSFKEDDDLTPWNIRKIDKKHPLYDKKMARNAKIFIRGYKTVMRMFKD